MQLLSPYLSPVVQELFEMVAAGKAWTMNHVPTAIKEVVEGIQVGYPIFFSNLNRTKILVTEAFPFFLQEMVPMIPTPLLLLLSHLDAIRPEGIKPLAGSSLVQMIVSALYGLINRWRKHKKEIIVPRETYEC